MLEQKMQILIQTVNVNLMMYRECKTVGYYYKAIQAWRTLEKLVENENEVTKEWRIAG
jgi:hypothetical protein